MSDDRFIELLKQRRRGRFKLYIGMAAGVGKTCRMLQDAHDLLRRGEQILIGVIVTHGRADTVRLAEGLPAMPLKQVFYKGKALEEMDLEGLLAVRPEVVIVDELAHTNAPGSRHEKRWQDVEALLSAGLNVISAVNIQHLESVAPVVERITGAPVAERIPDRLVLMADEVVNIDLPAEELVQRLREGKIYEPAKVAAALQNFFRPEHLLQLRELALRESARQIDRLISAQIPAKQRPPAARICVCISANEQTSAKLIRKAARLADWYGAVWHVVYVQTGHEAPDKIALAAQRHLMNAFKLATELGAQVETLKGDDVARTLVAFIQRAEISLLILGKTRRTWLSTLWRGDMVRRIIKHTDDYALDILIVGAWDS